MYLNLYVYKYNTYKIYMWTYSHVYVYENLVCECEHASFSFRDKVTEF